MISEGSAQWKYMVRSTLLHLVLWGGPSGGISEVQHFRCISGCILDIFLELFTISLIFRNHTFAKILSSYVGSIAYSAASSWLEKTLHRSMWSCSLECRSARPRSRMMLKMPLVHNVWYQRGPHSKNTCGAKHSPASCSLRWPFGGNLRSSTF